ncbi:MAG: TRASH domain-containing protein [Saccharolobus sp.]
MDKNNKPIRQILSIPNFGTCVECGKEVEDAEFILVNKNKAYLFCSKSCFRKWLRETRIHYGD